MLPLARRRPKLAECCLLPQRTSTLHNYLQYIIALVHPNRFSSVRTLTILEILAFVIIKSYGKEYNIIASFHGTYCPRLRSRRLVRAAGGIQSTQNTATCIKLTSLNLLVFLIRWTKKEQKILFEKMLSNHK